MFRLLAADAQTIGYQYIKSAGREPMRARNKLSSVATELYETVLYPVKLLNPVCMW